MHRRLIITGAASTLTAALLVTAPTNAAPANDTSALREAVTAEGVNNHLEELQAIADANGGTRASGTPGYDASAEYVAGLLSDAGYDVTTQEFEYEKFTELSPSVLDVTPDAPGEPYADHEDFIVMEYSGDGTATAALQAVDVTLPPAAAPSSTSGCEATDFAGFTAGNIAVVQRGTCTFREKVDNAEAAGASAVIVFNEGQEGRTDLLNGTLGAPQAGIPALGTTFAVGEELVAAANAGATATVTTDVEVTTETTSNVIAATPTGRTDRVVMAGAHLDSVAEGPGINDNGSGTAAILETALQIAELGIEPTNQLKFAFWGAEESGLIGSTHYVTSLPKKELKDIEAYLNFDMVGSPNYVRFVYDGDGSAFGLDGPNGSAHIERTFVDYFASQNLASEPTEFSGRSDYQAFIEAGIPAGGLFTGAEGVKTEEEAATYGGTAGVAYDECYHAACDDITNISMSALDEMSDALAHTTLTYALSNSSLNGTKNSATVSTGDYKGSHAFR